jgi:hypothetical protein
MGTLVIIIFGIPKIIYSTHHPPADQLFKPSFSTLKQKIDTLNRYSLLEYMKVLGYTPTFVNEEYTIFIVPRPDGIDALLTIFNRTNRFRFHLKVTDGGVVELACLLFKVNPKDLLDNLVPYRLGVLMSSDIGHGGHRA